MEQVQKQKLADLQVGDTVVIRSRNAFGLPPVRFLKITKITKTQIVCGNLRFRIDSGYEVGSTVWSKICICIPEVQDYITYRIYKAQVFLSKFAVTEQNLKEVEAMIENIKSMEITNENSKG